MNKATWTTSDGGKIFICDMVDAHLASTIKMLDRHARREFREAVLDGYDMLGVLSGEMAVDSVERDLDYLEQQGPDELKPDVYWNLVAEANRRGLDI